ncbi:hypothetical protein EDD11_008778, partial [Mortierella claussenii]
MTFRTTPFLILAIILATCALTSAAPIAPVERDAGAASNSPGVLSGNVIQVPVHVPVNVCGNTINVIG